LLPDGIRYQHWTSTLAAPRRLRGCFLLGAGETGRTPETGTARTNPANDFVREFIGGDASIKRLSRLCVADLLHRKFFLLPVATVMTAALLAACGKSGDPARRTGHLDADALRHAAQAVFQRARDPAVRRRRRWKPSRGRNRNPGRRKKYIAGSSRNSGFDSRSGHYFGDGASVRG